MLSTNNQISFDRLELRDFPSSFFEDLTKIGVIDAHNYTKKILEAASFVSFRASEFREVHSFIAYYQNDSYTFISMVWTADNYRNQGLAKTLLSFLISKIGGEFRLEVVKSSNQESLYRSLAFFEYQGIPNSNRILMRRRDGVAIMQPYLVPSLKYFQLLFSVSHFVFLDDVSFQKSGWVSRNTIRKHRLSEETQYISVPIQRASQNSNINETRIFSPDTFSEKIIRSIQHAYGKAPYFTEVFPYIREIFGFGATSISSFSINSIHVLSEYLGLKPVTSIASVSFPYTKKLERCERLSSITKELGYVRYVNSVGGQEIYSKEDFSKQGVDLLFLKDLSLKNSTRQNSSAVFSIIDDLMSCSPNVVKQKLLQYQLS